MPEPKQPFQPDEGTPGTQTLPKQDIDTDQEKKYAPLYHVILHDDDKHTYQYVVAMLMQLFGKSAERAFLHAEEVDRIGVSIIDTTTFERAELKADQIRAFGADPLIENCPGSMFASIEPVGND